MHKSFHSVWITAGLLYLESGVVQARPNPGEAQVSSYSFQCNHPPVRLLGREFRTPKNYGMQPAPSAAVFFRPSQPQSPAPPHLAAWGGTVVQPQGARLCSITSNGPIPSHSVVCIGRGNRYLDQAEVISSGQVVALLEPTGSATLAPGDWVTLVTVPTPVAPPAYSGGSVNFGGGRYHPTSTNADPTYQRWLHQGFTLGGITLGRSNCRSSHW